MMYSSREIQTLNLLSDNTDMGVRFKTPRDLAYMAWFIIVLIITTIVCSIIFEVDKIVPANGVIDTKYKLFDVRTNQDGFIDAIYVEEGQWVKKGQSLLEFDSEIIDYEIASLEQELKMFSRNIWTEFYKIKSILNANSALKLSSSLSHIPDLVSQNDYHYELSNVLDNKLKMVDENIKSLLEIIESNKRLLIIIDEQKLIDEKELNRLIHLSKKHFTSSVSIDEQKKRLLILSGTIEELSAKVEDDQITVAKLELEKTTHINQARVDGLTRINTLLDSYDQSSFQLEKLFRKRKDLNIIAPFDGSVDQVLVKGQQEAVRSGTTLFQLRKSYDKQDLKIDILIPSQHAVWVEKGMTLRASSMGNSPEDHGYIHGEIDFVSPSSEEINGQRMYRMTGRIERFEPKISKSNTELAENLLRPGMQLTVEIKAGNRRLINYLFDPFTKHFRTALTEP